MYESEPTQPMAEPLALPPIAAEETERVPPPPPAPSEAGTAEPTLPIDGRPKQASVLNEDIYVQHPRKFVRQSREEAAAAAAALEVRRRLEAGGAEGLDPPDLRALRSVLGAQGAFLTAAVFAKGLLAGFTICEACVVWLLTPPWEPQLGVLAPLALPSHALFYVVTTLTALASLDRYDVGQSFLRTARRALTLQSGGLAMVAYFGVLALSLLCLPALERLELYREEPRHLLEDGEEARIKPSALGELGWLRVALLTRAVLATLGWLLVALRPGTHLLAKHAAEAAELQEPEKPKEAGP